jgi:predicted ATPase
MGESGFLGEVEVKFLRDKHLGVAVSFQDVGVGLSQVLPLLLAINTLRISPGEELIIAEQPELHLHPKMQAELAELMFNESQANGQIIAETHSESILLRLQKIVRELHHAGKSYDSVGVIYAAFDPELGTQFENLELRRDLDFIVLLPTSFSDLRMDEL